MMSIATKTSDRSYNAHKTITKIIMVMAVIFVVYRIVLLIKHTVLLKTVKTKESVIDISNGIFKSIVQSVNASSPADTKNTNKNKNKNKNKKILRRFE